jgi:methylaspartate mutase epsilon subunit
MEVYRLLIGSIGDDSHSVGTSLLDIAFKEAGFFVKNLGILCTVDDFFWHADRFDAIFISCMNGHLDLYLKDFSIKLRRFNRRNGAPRLWYLGGNLSIQQSDEEVVRKYLKMGFDFVSPKPVSFTTIMERLAKDFYKKKIRKKRVEDTEDSITVRPSDLESVDDLPLTDRQFSAMRETVLNSWPTGEGVLQADIRKNHSCQHKELHNLLVKHQCNQTKPLIQPRTGVAHTCDEIDILLYLRENGLDVASIQLDAASRKKMFKQAEEGVVKTEKGQISFLNGYPVPIHGVAGIEKIVRAIDTPFQIRAGSPDHRLVYEIGLAGGASSVEGGFICYLFPYDKYTSPIESLGYWKYVDKLVNWYYENHHITVNREYFGPLTCCLIEPSIPICVNIVQAILSAKSGVRCISVGLAEQGNRIQDIAAVRVLDKMTRLYLARHGFSDVTVTTVFHHYMAAFPTDINKARDLIVNSSITGALARASRIMTKTPVEASHIPRREDNAEGLKLTHQGLLMSKDISVDWPGVQKESQLLELEVRAIMEVIEELGQGSAARGAIRAFECGILDIPFSPSTYNRNKLITVRDQDGAIRFANPEILPFSKDTVDFHKEKIYQRQTAEGKIKIFEILEEDLTRIWKNDFVKWPLDGHYIS